MIYTYEGCCGAHLVERTCRLAEYEQSPGYSCPNCGRPLRRVLTAPRVLLHTTPFESFVSPVDGSIVHSRRELAEHNKRNNVVNTHDGYDEKAILNMVNKDFQKPLDEERRSDLADDMRKAVQKLEEGYTPTPANEGDEL